MIPKDHILHGLNYSDPAPKIEKEWVGEQLVGKRGIIDLLIHAKDERPSISVVFDVHGSLTFSGDRYSDGAWWLGFDCAHSGDLRDPSIQSEEFKHSFARMQEILQNMLGPLYEGEEWKGEDDMGFGAGKIRTKEYVAAECKRLINQIQRLYPYPKLG